MIDTTHSMPQATAPMTGILSGDGTDVVRVTVYSHPAPAQPPDDIAGLVRPMHDEQGHFRDWRLSPAQPDHHVGSSEFHRYREWRAGFATERYIGERALIRSFLDWAHGRCPVSTLEILRLPDAHVDFHKALMMARQADGACRPHARETLSDTAFTAPRPWSGCPGC
jgi:hypothetical protein